MSAAAAVLIVLENKEKYAARAALYSLYTYTRYLPPFFLNLRQRLSLDVGTCSSW